LRRGRGRNSRDFDPFQERFEKKEEIHYGVSLLFVSSACWRRGLLSRKALAVLLPLMRGGEGVAGALTGPFLRGDTGKKTICNSRAMHAFLGAEPYRGKGEKKSASGRQIVRPRKVVGET